MITKLTPYMITHAKSFEKDFTKEEWIDFGKYKTHKIFYYKIYQWALDSIKGEELETCLLVNFLWQRGYTDFVDPSTQTYVFVTEEDSPYEPAIESVISKEGEE